jgi:hypothetical protein
MIKPITMVKKTTIQQSLKENQHEDLVMNYKLFKKLFKSKIISG